MITNTKWKQNVYDAIETISDLDFQERIWVRGEDQDKYFSSYVEAICSLDDSVFDDFIGKDWPQFGLSDILHQKLVRLKDALDNYNIEDNLTDEQVVNDPEWIKITKIAKEALIQMKKEMGLSLET